MSKLLHIAPREILGLTMEEYQSATFIAEGVEYSLADDIREHLAKLLLADQREMEKETGHRFTPPMKRAHFKKREDHSG